MDYAPINIGSVFEMLHKRFSMTTFSVSAVLMGFFTSFRMTKNLVKTNKMTNAFLCERVFTEQIMSLLNK